MVVEAVIIWCINLIICLEYNILGLGFFAFYYLQVNLMLIRDVIS